MKPDFEQDPNKLLPAIIQNAITEQVLMLGYMNEAAYEKTLLEEKVTFFSRSKNRLWTKGETSGNFLKVQNVAVDCDCDAILIRVLPEGPTCHTGSESCFGNAPKGFLYQLEDIISQRLSSPVADSYTASLVSGGLAKVAQKVGEEAVEVVIEAMTGNTERLQQESADLLFHLLVLLRANGITIEDIEKILQQRNQKSEVAKT